MVYLASEKSKIGRVVATEGSPSFTQIDIRLDSANSVIPGQLLYCDLTNSETEKQYVILRVATAWEYNRYENPLSPQVREVFSIDSSRGREDLLEKFVLARTQALEVLRVEQDGKSVSDDPSIIVPAGTEVFRMEPDVFKRTMGFLDDAAGAGLNVGTVAGSTSTSVIIDANSALPRHILVVGSTGTGKSYLLGVIAEQLSCPWNQTCER